MNRIITISREFGSGGRTIAKMAGEKLGIPVLDYEILAKIAKESGFAENYIEERAENTSISHIISRGLSGLGSYGAASAEDLLWQAQVKVIEEIAAKENCIIVGRCADFILRDKADLCRVFIYADKETRAHRIVNVYGDNTKKDPMTRLKEKDKRRSAFYNYQTDLKWGDPHNYQICLNSGEIGFEPCVEIICALYYRNAKNDPTGSGKF